MKIETSVTLLVNDGAAHLTIQDTKASATLLQMEIPAKEFMQLLSRLSSVKVMADVYNLGKIGKVQHNDSFSFEIPKMDYKEKEDENKLTEMAIKALADANMSEWTPDKYFRSQSSFFSKGGKDYARVTIRKWTEK